jgi:hypothetical protein
MSAPAFVILIVCFTSIALADDFKTNDGKEYKDVKVSRVEPDGIVLITKFGISKVYFSELPKDVRERFHYDPEKAAAAYAAQQAANRQADELARQAARQKDELDKQQEPERQRQWAERQAQQAKQGNIQAMVDRLSELQVQEENLLVQIGQAEKTATDNRRRWISQDGMVYSDPSEAQQPLLRGRLDNVRDEKRRIERELEQARRQP